MHGCLPSREDLPALFLGNSVQDGDLRGGLEAWGNMETGIWRIFILYCCFGSGMMVGIDHRVGFGALLRRDVVNFRMQMK